MKTSLFSYYDPAYHISKRIDDLFNYFFLSANKAVEVNEMWRARQKELELEGRIKERSRDERTNSQTHHKDRVSTSRSTDKGHADNDDSGRDSCSSSKRLLEKSYTDKDEDRGLRDEEVEEFLQSRVKRGRGAIGSRMDETGPYLTSDEGTYEMVSSHPDAWAQRVVFGPEKIFPLKSCGSAIEETSKDRQQKAKKDKSEKHSRKHRSKDKSRDGKKKKSRDERKKRYGKSHRD